MLYKARPRTKPEMAIEANAFQKQRRKSANNSEKVILSSIKILKITKAQGTEIAHSKTKAG